MKKVFNNNELSHVWATETQSEGKAGSFYFKGKTIYSYGYHFPIATIDGNNVLFTKRSYSNTTAKHIGLTRRAISHKNIIYCYYVPINLKYATHEHSQNMESWKKAILVVFNELGNKKIRNIQDRLNTLSNLIDELKTYCKYFKISIKDNELKKFLKLATLPNFLEQVREAKEKVNAANELKLNKASKVYNNYLKLWRLFNDDAIQELPAKTKELINLYKNSNISNTHLRYNKSKNRLETSKGVEIPCELAKTAYLQLNNCMDVACKSLNIPILSYTITETTKYSVIAGCHTIPKDDINYISNLLNWN